jgi:hypothetical protein
MKTKNRTNEKTAHLNRIIHTQNLYSGHSRFIHAKAVDGVVTVENLHTGERVPFVEGAFRDGYGYPVTLA